MNPAEIVIKTKIVELFAYTDYDQKIVKMAQNFICIFNVDFYSI